MAEWVKHEAASAMAGVPVMQLEADEDDHAMASISPMPDGSTTVSITINAKLANPEAFAESALVTLIRDRDLWRQAGG